MESKKLTSNEIQEVTEIRRKFAELMNQYGVVSFSEHRLKKEKEQIEEEVDKLQKREEKFLASIHEKYGDGSIHLETGEFVPEDTE